MTTTIGPDGLTDEERAKKDEVRGLTHMAYASALGETLFKLAAERKAHTETRKERDALDRHYVALVEEAKKKLADAGAVIDELRSRKSGIFYEDVREALRGLEDGEASYSRLVEVMRGAVETQTAELRASADTALADVAALREALEDTKLGDDRDDGRPCWCGSPSYPAHRRNTVRPEHNGHTPACGRRRVLLGKAGG